MSTHTLITIADLLIMITLIGMLIWDMLTMKKLKDLIRFQDGLIKLQHICLMTKGKQEKCCGSTSDSKPESQGSTPCSCATICKELNK